MKYSIVIPTYNNCDKFLKPCIEALLKYSNLKDIEIIISANGCTDNTIDFLGNLKDDFNYLNLNKHLKIVWNKEPLGYAKATNRGIEVSSCEFVVLLNNDAILIGQNKNDWLNVLYQPFTTNSKVGITCSLKRFSEITKMDFAVFFCAMIHRKLFNELGLLDERYTTGGNEDIDFSAAAQLKGYEIIQPIPLIWSDEIQLHVGAFPLYHKGEGTVHDPILVQNWEKTFRQNELKLAEKYNLEYYEKFKDRV